MVDAGTKLHVSTDAGMPLVYGRPGIRYVRGDDEHGRLILSGEESELLLGEKLLLQPSNCDPTVNCTTGTSWCRAALRLRQPVARGASF